MPESNQSSCGSVLGQRTGTTRGNIGPSARDLPLYLVLAAGGTPLVLDLTLKALRRQR